MDSNSDTDIMIGTDKDGIAEELFQSQLNLISHVNFPHIMSTWKSQWWAVNLFLIKLMEYYITVDRTYIFLSGKKQKTKNTPPLKNNKCI